MPAARSQIDAAGRSDRGMVRPVNEDHFLIGELEKTLRVAAASLPIGDGRQVGVAEGQVFCVADGLGGHRAGERASATAVDATMDYLLNTMPCFYRSRGQAESGLREELAAAVRRAQGAVEARAQADESLRGMGTTLTLAYLQWPRLYLVHVGDSRCYLLRGGLRQMTRDHTIRQKLIEEGRLRPDEAGDSMLAHSLWNAIGDEVQELVTDLGTVDLEAGDTLLLCTDGLNTHVSDDAIEAILLRRTNAAEAARALVDAALQAGGTDNVTVIAVRIPEDAPAQLRLAADPTTA